MRRDYLFNKTDMINIKISSFLFSELNGVKTPPRFASLIDSCTSFVSMLDSISIKNRELNQISISSPSKLQVRRSVASFAKSMSSAKSDNSDPANFNLIR